MESFHEDSYWTKRRKIHARVASHLNNLQNLGEIDSDANQSENDETRLDDNDVPANFHDHDDGCEELSSSCDEFECSLETIISGIPDANEHELNVETDDDLVYQMCSNDMSRVHGSVMESAFSNGSESESETEFFNSESESDIPDSEFMDEKCADMSAKLAEWAN